MPALGPGVIGFDKDFVTVVWSDTSVPYMNPEIRVHRYIEIIIFGSILITFELSSIFGGSWGSIENWLEPKIEPPLGNLVSPNL